MKLLIFSDIHTEFQKDYGESFLKSQKDVEYDVCVIAGDITDYNTLNSTLPILADNFKEVVFVIGNHECYGGSIEKAKNKVHEACDKYSNLHFLNNSSIEISGQRFIGGTLWFRDAPDNIIYARDWGDFFEITNFQKDVYLENKKSIKYLTKTMCSTDVVITHYLPSNKCIVERFKGNPYNRFFLCDIEGLIVERQPKLCVFGHTHSSVDFVIDNTRLICNPFGYAGHEENPNFIEKFVIDI